jgi:protein phosphatase
MPEFDIAWRAGKGARPYQEDALAFWPGSSPIDPGVAGATIPASLVVVLADGMGGHAGGAVASRLVCECFMRTFGETDASVPERLGAALVAANDAIARATGENPLLSGMGSTVLGTVFGDDGLRWLSVGDSPLYLYRSGEVALLNEDHSLAPALDLMAEAGRITAEQARSDPRRHMLRSAVTGEELELVDLSRKPLELEPGDYVILASDGIHTLAIDEIARLVAAFGPDGPDAVADALMREVDRVKDPTQDNITILVARPRPAP